MLSNTGGLRRYSSALGYHRDDLSKQTTVCPVLRRRGRCWAFEQETAIRQELAREKEAELHKKALAMYNLQVELLAEMGDDADSDDAEVAKIRELLGGDGKVDKETVVAKLVKELQQEPEYLHWSLDAAVAERLVERRVRPCKYSHRADALTSLKRARRTDTAEERALGEQEQRERDKAAAAQQQRQQDGSGDQGPSTTAAAPAERRGAAPRSAVDAFARDRERVFRSFSPLQRCVACMMVQGTLSLPLHVVCPDVRRLVEEEVEAEMQSRHGGSGADAVEAAVDAFVATSDFEARVAAAEGRVVEHTAFRAGLGVLDLSSLPQIVAFLSRPARGAAAAAAAAIADDTLAFFGAPRETLFAPAAAAGGGGRPQQLTEKELDLSTAPRAAELTEAIEWALHVCNTGRRLGTAAAAGGEAAGAAAVQQKRAFMTASHRAGRVVLRGLTLRRCQITAAESLVTALHKRGLGRHLLSLDLSDNRLHSLRFLFALRANFAERLLRLSLRNNLITRKPEYQEQVRRSLPRLASLDGEPIRRPPLPFPKPNPNSATACTVAANPPRGAAKATAGGEQQRLTQAEHNLVMETIARFFYIWETRRIPHTDIERRAFLAASAAEEAPRDDSDEAVAARLPEEEELHEDNFPHRYLDPAVSYTFTASPGVELFDAAAMKLDREVEFDDDFAGMRLNALDMKDARVFDVSIKNGSRNLLMGRPAIQRFGRGPDNCFAAYNFSVYPERLAVNHDLSGAVVSIVKIPLAAATPAGGAATKKRGFGSAASKAASGACMYLATIHGVMTWRLPSMRGAQCFSAQYDRTMTFTHKMLAAQNYEWERRRSPKLVLRTDQLLLRPVPAPDSVGAARRGLALYSPATAARAARLVVQFGLEACTDGEALVWAVMERTRSDAAEEAALDALVFGPPEKRDSGDGDEEEEQQPTAGHAAGALDDALRGVFAALPTLPAEAGRTFHIFSLLDRTGAAPPADSAAAAATPAAAKWGGSQLHDVPPALVSAVIAAANEHCVLAAFEGGRRTAQWMPLQPSDTSV